MSPEDACARAAARHRQAVLSAHRALLLRGAATAAAARLTAVRLDSGARHDRMLECRAGSERP